MYDAAGCAGHLAAALDPAVVFNWQRHDHQRLLPAILNSPLDGSGRVKGTFASSGSSRPSDGGMPQCVNNITHNHYIWPQACPARQSRPLSTPISPAAQPQGGLISLPKPLAPKPLQTRPLENAAPQAAAGDSTPAPEPKRFLGFELITWQKILPLGFMFFCILFNYTILRDTKVRRVRTPTIELPHPFPPRPSGPAARAFGDVDAPVSAPRRTCSS